MRHHAQRTAKWTAITDRLAGTHGHTGSLSSQVEATDALAGGSLDLHGMQEARGSSPLSSTGQRTKARPSSSAVSRSGSQPAVETLGERDDDGQL